MRLLTIAALLAAVVALAACGASKEAGPRKLEVASIGKDSTGDDLDPETMAAKGDRIWVDIGNEIASVDGSSGKLTTQPQAVDPDHNVIWDVGAGDTGVWAVASGDGPAVVIPVDEGTGRPGAPIEVKLDSSSIKSGSGLEVAVGNGRVWVTLTDSPVVVSLDPTTGEQRQFDTGGAVQGIAAGPGAGWAVTTPTDDTLGDGALVRMNDDGTKSSKPLDSGPSSIAVHGDDVWVLTDDGAERHDASGARTADISLEGYDVGVGTIAAGDDSVWVLAYGDQKLVRIEPKTGKVEPPPLFTPEEPRDIAVAGGYVWSTANFEPPRRARD